MKYIRNVVSTLSAIIASAAVIAGCEAVAHATLTGEARFVAVTVGYGLGALAGSTIATFMGLPRVALAVSVLLAVLAVVNLLSFPHPWWFTPVAFLTLTAGWLVGRQIGGLLRDSRASTS
jgi:hypothetical protein